ncbi:peptidylprolyl isomerase [Pseudostreptobacillus hongkongensis]|uniref:peptidylprolyl isomerase n=1 Tax=Pseudostreptobacillus hongkongensis TaxID=1162717 RepID=UPI0028D20A91|nr:peptidylprolyl isomerase [Pseudostreptobacillus hongkongensis]
MALRKMGKPMKIVTIIIAICMIIPIVIQGYAFLSNRDKKTVVMKIDGEKIYKEDFESKYQTALAKIKEVDAGIIESKKLDKEKYKSMPEDVIKEYVLSDLLTESLNKLLTKQLGAKVSKSAIDAKYKELEDQMGGAQKLILALNAQGQSVQSLRENIENYLLAEKRKEIIEEKIAVTDEEITARYNQLKYGEYEGKTLEESKESIKKLIRDERSALYENSLLENILLNAKTSFKDKDIEAVYNRINEDFYVQGEYKFKKFDVINQILNQYVTEGNGYTDELLNSIKDGLKANLDRSIKIKDKALEAGLKLNEDLLPKYQLEYITNEYVQYLLNTYKASEQEMREIFNTYRSEFNIKHTISGEIIGMPYATTEEDAKETENKVKEIMKTLTKDNFAARARELSKDPGSAKNGGDLGEADITNYVTEFKDAIAAAKAGDIVGPVRTQFGYHIIYVVSKNKDNKNIVKASHILIPIEVTEKTKEATKAKILALKEQIATNKVTWDDIKSDKTGKYKEFSILDSFAKVTENTNLPQIGYNKEINDKLFNAKVGEFIEIPEANSFIIVQKTEDTPFKEVTFEEAKEKLNLLAASQYAVKVLKEI